MTEPNLVPAELAIEAMRYAMLEDCPVTDGDSAIIRAVWELYNPLSLSERKHDVSYETDEDGKPLLVTAHSHTNEPTEKSYEDVLVYRRLRVAGGESAHYIVDRFYLKKV